MSSFATCVLMSLVGHLMGLVPASFESTLTSESTLTCDILQLGAEQESSRETLRKCGRGSGVWDEGWD